MLTVGISRSSGAVPDGNTSAQRPNLVPGVSDLPGGRTHLRAVAQSGRVRHSGERHVGQRRTLDRHRPRPGPGGLLRCRRTPVAEGKALVFRIETFNIFNRTQAGNPGTTFTSPASFGLVNSGLNRTIGTGTSRQLQLALRFNF